MIAADNASNAAYSGGWGAGTGGGSTIGFGNWIDSSSGGSSTHFTTTSPEIDTVGNKSWGSFNSGGVADFNRTINNNLQVGHTLAFDFDNKSVGSGGPSVGVSLRNGTTNLFEFYFNGGATSYSINDNSNSNRNTGIPFTSAGLHLEFTLTAANAYSLAVTPLPSGTTTTFTGNLVGNSSNAINTFRVFDANAGNGNNFYINTTNILLPTWNGLNVGAAGGTFSNSGNWAAHAPVNGGSIAFDGTGSTVTDDSRPPGSRRSPTSYSTAPAIAPVARMPPSPPTPEPTRCKARGSPPEPASRSPPESPTTAPMFRTSISREPAAPSASRFPRPKHSMAAPEA